MLTRDIQLLRSDRLLCCAALPNVNCMLNDRYFWKMLCYYHLRAFYHQSFRATPQPTFSSTSFCDIYALTNHVMCSHHRKPQSYSREHLQLKKPAIILMPFLGNMETVPQYLHAVRYSLPTLSASFLVKPAEFHRLRCTLLMATDEWLIQRHNF